MSPFHLMGPKTHGEKHDEVPAHSHSKCRPRGTRKLSEEGRKACLPSSDIWNALMN